MPPPRGNHYSYSEEALLAACQTVTEDGIRICHAAKKYGVPKSTLSARLHGRPAFRTSWKFALTPEEEENIVVSLIESSQQGFSQTKEQLLSTVQAMLQKNKRITSFMDNRPGRSWYKKFLERHKEIPIKKYSSLVPLGAEEIKRKIQDWFETARHTITAKDADVLNHPERIFHCDESEFELRGRITSTHLQYRPKDKRSTSIRETSVLACGSASGDTLPPLVIFPGVRFRFNPLKGFPTAHFDKSPNGYIDTDIFKRWLEVCFIPAIKDLPKPVLLFVDAYKTHVNLVVREFCRDHDIILYQLLMCPHLLVQPLDLSTFKTLKKSWRDEVLNYQKENKGVFLTKKDFAKVFRMAWKSGVQKDFLISRFKAAGIYPLSSDHIDTTKLQRPRLFTEPTDKSKDQTSVPVETNGQRIEDIQMAERHDDDLFYVSGQDVKLTLHVPPNCNDNLPQSPLSCTSASVLPFLPNSKSLKQNVNVNDAPCKSHSHVSQLMNWDTESDEDIDLNSSCQIVTRNAPRKLSNAEALDKILLIAASFKMKKMSDIITILDLNKQLEKTDPMVAQFCNLYHQLSNLAANSDINESLPLEERQNKCLSQHR